MRPSRSWATLGRTKQPSPDAGACAGTGRGLTSAVGDPEPYPALQALPPSTGMFAQRVGGLPTEAQILAHEFDDA